MVEELFSVGELLGWRIILHYHTDHVSIRQQSQELAGEASVPYSVVGCCEVDKHSSGLLFRREAILCVLRQQGDMIYGRFPVSKARLLMWEHWVDDWVDTSVDKSLEDFKGNTQQRYGTIALWVPQWLFWFSHCNYQCSSPNLWNFELAHAGIEEVAKPRFESRPGVEYELWDDGIQSRRLSWLQASEGSSKLLRCKGFRDTVTLRCWNLPTVRQLLVDQPGELSISDPVCPVLHELCDDGVC